MSQLHALFPTRARLCSTLRRQPERLRRPRRQIDELHELAARQRAEDAIRRTLRTRHGIKPAQVMMPLRALVAGTLRTPAIDAVLELFDRDVILARVRKYL